MKTSRKQIRDAVRSHINTAIPTIQAFTRRSVDASGLSDFVTVYLSSGDIQFEGMQSYTTATLGISIYGNLHCEDDELDELGELIQSQLNTDFYLGGLIRGMQYTGFEYPMDDEPHFNQLVLNYSIQYQGD